MPKGEQKSRLVDNPEIVSTYASRFVSASFDGASFILTFGEMRLLPEYLGEVPKTDHGPDVAVVDRLALSPNAAIELVNQLSTMFIQMGIKHGTVTPQPATPQKAN